MKIIQKNVMSGKERVLASHIPASRTEEARIHFINNLYKNNTYGDFVIEVRPDGHSNERY